MYFPKYWALPLRCQSRVGFCLCFFRVATSTSGVTKCKRNLRSVLFVLWDAAELRDAVWGDILQYFTAALFWHAYQTPTWQRKGETFVPSLLLRIFLRAKERERERERERVLCFSGGQRAFFVVLFIFHVCVSGSSNSSGESAHAHLCENTDSLCVFGEQ